MHIALLIFKSRQGAHADIASVTPDNRNMVNVDFYGNENVSRETLEKKEKAENGIARTGDGFASRKSRKKGIKTGKRMFHVKH